MHIPKRYGESKRQVCPFCNKPAVTKNSQGVPVCISHKSESLDLKCICGEWLDVRSGKWGPFFSCTRCGNISLSKALEANHGIGSGQPSSAVKAAAGKRAEPVRSPMSGSASGRAKEKKEVVITSDEVDLFY